MRSHCSKFNCDTRSLALTASTAPQMAHIYHYFPLSVFNLRFDWHFSCKNKANNSNHTFAQTTNIFGTTNILCTTNISGTTKSSFWYVPLASPSLACRHIVFAFFATPSHFSLAPLRYLILLWNPSFAMKQMRPCTPWLCLDNTLPPQSQRTAFTFCGTNIYWKTKRAEARL